MMWKRLILTLAIGLGLPNLSAAAVQEPAPSPVVENALDGIFAQFRQHPLVLLGDAHHLAQEGAFYAALVRDPRFAKDVGDLVVEFGGAAHQDIIDRYVAGESVSYPELRRVWTDLVGWEAPASQMYAELFATVRAANATLPPERRIKVWLGEPPIDWTKLHGPADLDPFMMQRDSYPAGLVNREVLGRGRKALVIYGKGHFLSTMFGPNVRDIIEREHPGSTYLIVPYAGYRQRDCAQSIEAPASAWPTPALVAPVKNSWIGSALLRCVNSAGIHSPNPTRVARTAHEMSGSTADALLYLGPGANLLQDAAEPSLYLDPPYTAEWNRTRSCCLPAEAVTIDPDDVLRENTTVLRPYPLR